MIPLVQTAQQLYSPGPRYTVYTAVKIRVNATKYQRQVYTVYIQTNLLGRCTLYIQTSLLGRCTLYIQTSLLGRCTPYIQTSLLSRCLLYIQTSLLVGVHCTYRLIYLVGAHCTVYIQTNLLGRMYTFNADQSAWQVFTVHTN